MKNGTWSGAPTSYTYQWFRCTSAVKKAAATPAASCSTINSAIAANYTLTDADAGKFMVARVSGMNATGTVSIHSASTVAITPLVIAPKNTVAGVITGTAQVSRALTASNGTWIENPEDYSYQWMRCTKVVSKAAAATPRTCAPINGETESTYQLGAADRSKFIAVKITASNSGGNATILTKSTAAVGLPTNYAPSLLVSPDIQYSGDTSPEPTSAISGDAMLGSVLVASKGQWLGYPLPEVSYSYWYRCDLPHTTAPTSRPSDCYAIAGSNGANGETFLVTSEDVGRYLAFEVIATNNLGTARYFTATTGEVTAAPTLISQPTVTGSPRFGQTLTTSQGRWSAAP